MKVGVISKLIKSPYGEILQAIDIRFCKVLKDNGFTPILLNYSSLELENLKGIVISGGNDLNINVQSDLNLLRDDFESNIIKKALIAKIPILGVCKGAQSLAKFLGARLTKVDNHTTSHEIIWRDADKLSVNSYHNFGIVLDFDAEILARYENLAEAFVNYKFKMIGQMWHFEREENLSFASKQVFEIFKGLM